MSNEDTRLFNKTVNWDEITQRDLSYAEYLRKHGIQLGIPITKKILELTEEFLYKETDIKSSHG